MGIQVVEKRVIPKTNCPIKQIRFQEWKFDFAYQRPPRMGTSIDTRGSAQSRTVGLFELKQTMKEAMQQTMLAFQSFDRHLGRLLCSSGLKTSKHGRIVGGNCSQLAADEGKESSGVLQKSVLHDVHHVKSLPAILNYVKS